MNRRLLEATGLSVGYGGRPVVSGVQLTVEPGEVLLVLGHNGAGKSTLLQTLFGLLPAIAGRATVANCRIPGSVPRDLIWAGCRYVAQQLRYFGNLRVDESRRVLTKLWGLEGAAEGFGDGQDSRRRVRELSFGQRKIELLRLMAVGSPQLFLLDEPTAGLDRATRQQFWEWLKCARSSGVGFVVVEQDFQTPLELADQCLIFKAGSVGYYGPAAPLRDRQALAAAFI
jgi:branched-chain amino acid transport system ATP-binding protein